MRGADTVDSFTESVTGSLTAGFDFDTLVSTYQLRSRCSSFRSSVFGADFSGLMYFS